MKQNNFYISILAAVLAGATLTACNPKSATLAGEGEAVVLGPQHSKKGLLLPEATRRSLGVKLVEVKEQKIPATLGVQLRVYQADKKSILASAAMTPEEAKALKRGMTVRARSNDTNLTGRVLRVNDELQKATGMTEVLVEFGGPSDAPVIGAFLSASVALDSDATVVTIPRAALLQCSDGYSVYTVSGEHLVRTPVKVGAANAELVEITDGLYSGDQVVLQPVMSLWMTELAAVKGGQACCVEPPKGK
jgi:hypothetical protein